METSKAIRCWNMLQNGMGGVDWSALSLAVELYHVDDVEQLIDDMLTIKGHSRPKGDDDAARDAVD